MRVSTLLLASWSKLSETCTTFTMLLRKKKIKRNKLHKRKIERNMMNFKGTQILNPVLSTLRLGTAKH